MPKFLLALTALALWTPSDCAAVNWNPTTWELPSFSSEVAPAGTPAWWKKHKSKAEFVPGEGYRVEGFAGYFDQQGRPIQAVVAKILKQEKSKGLLEDINMTETMASFKQQVGMGPDEQQAKMAFAKGEDLFQRERYAEAAKQFKETVGRWPNTSLAQDALYQMAESQFFANEYSAAIETYDRLLKANPNSPHLDKIIRRQFDIARYWEQSHQHKPHWPVTPNFLDDKRPLFDTLGRAMKIYENIRLNDPTGPLADDAIMATANSFFVRGRYGDADYSYELIRNEYPRSEHQYEAHILGLQCKLRKYQGADYDGAPLFEAKNLAKQLRVQFAGKLNAEEKERLAVTQAMLQKQLADRDWKLAKFYEGQENYGSAKFYYAKVLRKFPNTPAASQARENYAILQDKPDSPPVKLAGIIKYIPDNAERQAIQQVPLLVPDSKTLIARPPSDADGSVVR